ncbi:hypothetical protein IFM89_001719 [Coptis chinensis]|uniref:Uncharacterized protein n=1 Tax=Coptis chinensis TaxID=261450 RepID=A0A835HMT6_9MAGN|nr:hypothetical protein IFM89_001719 [Coptis chinensis]
MANGFEAFEPIFGKANAEWASSNNSSSSSSSLSSTSFLPFLFHVHALDIYSLRIHVTDYHSYTFESILSIQQFEDMRDDIGVGGSWSEFVDYVIESLKTDNVKLVVGSAKSKNSDADHGAKLGKLIAHKSKGMPRISISLDRLMESSASDAMANLSLQLFKAFKSKHTLPVKEEQEKCQQLTNKSSIEQARHEHIQNQHDPVLFSRKQKLQKLSTSDNISPVTASSNLDLISVSDKHKSPKKRPTQDSHSTKVGHRAAPAYRRAKVRGAVLGDTEDGDDI